MAISQHAYERGLVMDPKSKGLVQITKLSVPNIRLTPQMITKIKSAFSLAHDYIADGEVSRCVENARGQYIHNSTVTGRVVMNVKGKSKPVTVDLFGYWPSWKLSENGKVRIYNKEHSAAIMSYMRDGTFSNPTSECLEQIAYNALSIVKARQTTPREGLIKAQILDYLESVGIEVVKCWYRGKEFDREFMTSKIRTMRTIFDAMQSANQFQPIEKKRGQGVFKVKGR